MKIIYSLIRHPFWQLVYFIFISHNIGILFKFSEIRKFGYANKHRARIKI
jgi:hypothetical protein